MSSRKKQKRKKPKKTKAKKKQAKTHTKYIPTSVDYYRETLFYELEEWRLPHPNQELWFRRNVEALCRKALSTQVKVLLDELYQKIDDVVLRGMLAKKMYLLNRDYLQSFHEYSDRALIQLAERENLFDKWEGIYILGCYGGRVALEYLRKRMKTEKAPLLIQTIRNAIYKIEKGIEARDL
ncbi:MAG: hypothetical protein ACE5HX_00590 [bacterium]